jgi:hypothetical protein
MYSRSYLVRYLSPKYYCPSSRLDQTSEDTLRVRKGRVNRGTPRGTSRTPRQHRVGDLGGTRREPTAHEGSRIKYRAGSTGERLKFVIRESRRVPTEYDIKALCFEASCFTSFAQNTKILLTFTN